jgi:hypothetical protein
LNTPTLGAEESSGALVVGTWYSITATQVNYFYTGCAVGNTFRAAATTALDANNKVKAITFATMIATHPSSTSNVMVTVAGTITSGTQEGAVLCSDSATAPTALMFAYCDGVTAKLDKYVAATGWTSVISAAVTYGAGYETRAVKNGSTVTLYYNQLKVGATTAVTDVEIISNTLHGLMSTLATNNTITTYALRALGNEGQYIELDKYIK